MKAFGFFRSFTLFLSFFVLVSNEGAAQSPGGVSTNLELWLKADAGTNCTTDGCSITSWSDQSGAGNNASGTGSTVYETEFANYNPGLYFTDDAQPITGSIARTNGTASTIFLAGNISQVADKCLFEIGTGSNRQWVIDQRYAGNTSYAFSTNIPSVWSISDPGGATDATIFESGKNIDTQNKSQNTDWTAGGGYYLGDDRTGGNRLTGYMGEAIYYDGLLSAADQQKVETYLAIKYGVTLTNDNNGDATTFEAPNGSGVNEGDYVNSSGTVIWDASANSAYHYDVAGIGRDDNSGLDQRKSLSQNTDGVILMDKGGAFGSDNDFILWGNNNGAISSTTVNPHPSYTYILNRVWRTEVIGTPGNVTVRIIVSNNGNAADYALLLDAADANFSAGATAHTTGASISGDTITFTNVALTDGMYFTLGSDVVVLDPSPGGIASDLKLWLKADAGTNCSTNGCAITSWADQSDENNDATGTGNTVFETNSINWKPSLGFTDDAQPISGTMSRSSGTGSSMFVVGNITQNADKCLFEPGNGTERQFVMDDRYAGNTSYGFRTNTPALWSISDPGGATNAVIYENAGNIDTQIKTFNTSWSGAGSYYVGDDQTGGNRLTGSISEVIYYDNQLSASSQQRVESYLAIKYGITLSKDIDGNSVNFESPNGDGVKEGDYVNSMGVSVWDITINSNYHNDVAGIGRDDNSDLDHRKSMSQNSDAIVIMDKGGSFSLDRNFILWGNNNQAISTTTVTAHPSYTYRLNRIWKVSVKGTPGNVTVRFVIPNNGNPADYALLKDPGNSDFSSGATAHTTGASISGDTITFTNVPFVNNSYFTLGTDVIIFYEAPGGVSTDLMLWLKADAGTNCTTNGCSLTSWGDQSQENHNATGTGDATFITNSINYNPGVDFTDDVKPFTGSINRPDGSSGSSLFAVGILPSISDKCMIEVGDGSDRAYFMDRRYAGGTSFAFNTNAPGLFLASDPGSTTAATIYENGENIDTQSKAGGTDWTSGGYELGDDNTGGNRLTAEMVEYAFYDQQLSASDQQIVESYMALKYGITLSNDNDGDGNALEAPNASGINEGDYLDSSGDVIWDASDGPGYRFGIIGIGRDDAAELDQKQSHTYDDTTRIYISSLAATNGANAGSFASDKSFVLMGHNRDRLCATMPSYVEVPATIESRLAREWKVTNTAFTGTFSIDIRLNTCVNLGSITDADLRLLVDADGDFSNAAIYSSGGGLALSNSGGIITVSGISTTQIASNTTSYITIGSASSASTPLPVELLSFQVEQVEEDALLKWSTATEVNNDRFEVERSSNGDDFERIASVQGAGTSSTISDYRHLDQGIMGSNINNTLYYRLKQIDFDGRYEYSEVQALYLSVGKEYLKLFPNPSRGVLFVEHSEMFDVTDLKVLDIRGQECTRLVGLKESGRNKLQLSISGLPTGMYYLRVGEKVLPFTKQ